jgi:hypothetical protein
MMNFSGGRNFENSKLPKTILFMWTYLNNKVLDLGEFKEKKQGGS